MKIKIKEIKLRTSKSEYIPNLELDINDWLSFEKNAQKNEIKILSTNLKEGCCVIFYTENSIK
jgi:hypothetical protein